MTARLHAAELMDDPQVPQADLERAFVFIRQVNRRLGGTAAALGALRRWTADWPRGREVSVLDLGTGSADIPLAMASWALQRGLKPRILAMDVHEGALACARRHLASLPRAAAFVELVQGDALEALARFGPESVDVAHAGMFLHHLSDEQVVDVLGQMRSMARVAPIWNDLTRDALSRLGVWLLTRSADAMVKHDATISVRSGFTRREALRLAHAAGWRRATYHRQLFGRFTLTDEPERC